MSTLIEALTVAVSSLKDGIPVAIVQEDQDYDAIPQAYLTDISYQGCRNAVAQYNDIGDIITEGDPAEYQDSEVAAWLAQNWEG